MSTVARLIAALAASFFCAYCLAGAPAISARLPLLAQASGLPAEFRDHFFEVPLAARVEKDGQVLGDAMVLLTRDGTVQLLGFTDAGDSRQPDAERQKWAEALGRPIGLGDCKERCPSGLLAIHYSLENSQLSLLTDAAGRRQAGAHYHAQPSGGSRGLILGNRLNLSGGGGQSLSGRYAMDLQGSLADWSALGGLQLERSADGRLRQNLSQLYAQRELDGHFVRAGLFSPDEQSLLRQPRTQGQRADAVLGLMAGSSDALLADSGQASLYPVYVTANREATVEIYRNGVLIHSQLVQPGLQLVDTLSLPGGIYPVEVRLLEDGVQVSRSEELIYKPSMWRNPEQRWRYSVFAGRQRKPFGVGAQSGGLALGGGINYLLHPRVVLGLASQQFGAQRQFGASVDWDLADSARLYANLFHTAGYGSGFDVQAVWSYSRGNVVLSHSRSSLDGDGDPEWRQARRSALSLSHRLSDRSNLNARLTHGGGLSVDLGLDHRHKLLGNDATWRLAAFDRAAGPGSGPRNRGVELSLNLSLGGEGRSYNASIGSRSGSLGSRDHYASVSVQQNLDNGWLSAVGATGSADSHGLGLSGSAQFQHALLRGDAYLQRSSLNGRLSGGLNLENTMAIGGGGIAASGDAAAFGANTGLIVDVESDLPAVALRADDSQGGSAWLHAGRNFIPVTAYQAGSVQFDFAGAGAPAVAIQPASHSYHLNKGGVAYRQVRVLKTVTVLGRLLDASGRPLRGARLINHAGRAVSEADGFFSLEMSESAPTLEVRHQTTADCRFRLDPARRQRAGDVLLAGDLRCPG
ncbi:pilus assembly protein PapC [Chromobacterium sp. ATCC 53434]|uniref:CS1-pili formation C-terminal domain-containing protein n=1 Tax=Chromobacterium sp. (strain ATCC 53434 / SC 14030) TaxID=2059672 RepID=UPI000C75903B|nr:CS1-pili formation C-terminal domain-containing protein [Chromobacterium sp. ATCC 53434]AUH51941.1 pilus assembly protein PapC [Chromobacterium sp. ATCC 53434]